MAVYGFLYHEGKASYFAVVQAPGEQPAATALLTHYAAGRGNGVLAVDTVRVLHDAPLVPAETNEALVVTTLALGQRE